MEKIDLSERLLDFAVRVVKLVEALPNTIVGRRIGDQLLRSGTSCGANYEEARGAESHNDFVHKLQISLKEIRETYFWLRVLYQAETLPQPRLEGMVEEARQIKAILSKSVATAKGTTRS